jgi:hypothetical protein
VDERGTRVEIARFPDDLSAQLAASRLRASGIEPTLISDDAGATYPSLQMVRGVRVLVAEEDEEAALEVLEGDDEETAGDDAG